MCTKLAWLFDDVLDFEGAVELVGHRDVGWERWLSFEVLGWNEHQKK